MAQITGIFLNEFIANIHRWLLNLSFLWTVKFEYKWQRSLAVHSHWRNNTILNIVNNPNWSSKVKNASEQIGMMVTREFWLCLKHKNAKNGKIILLGFFTIKPHFESTTLTFYVSHRGLRITHCLLCAFLHISSERYIFIDVIITISLKDCVDDWN